MNLENFRKVVQLIKAYPEEWDQGFWCGTCCCVAGKAAWMLKGHYSNLIERIIPIACKFLEINWDPERDEPLWLFNYRRTLEDFDDVLAGRRDEYGAYLTPESPVQVEFEDVCPQTEACLA